MKRLLFPQLVAQSWYPAVLKQRTAEFMTWFVNVAGAARPFVPIFEAALQHAPIHQLVNLRRAIGGGLECVIPLLTTPVTVQETDDPRAIPSVDGVYTFVNTFHQLDDEEAVAALSTPSRRRQPVVVVEGNNDNWWQAIGMLVFVPLSVLLLAPWVRPFRWSRLLFTYLVPILPLTTSYDGVAALFRLFSPDELLELAGQTGAPASYVWEAGKSDNGRGGKIIYLIGYDSQGRHANGPGS